MNEKIVKVEAEVEVRENINVKKRRFKEERLKATEETPTLAEFRF